MSVITILFLSFLPIILSVPVVYQDINPTDASFPTVFASEWTLQSILLEDKRKCLLKLVCHVGANYSTYGSFVHEIGQLKHWNESFDFDVVSRPLFQQILGSASDEIIDVASMNLLDQQTTEELLFRSDPLVDESMSGRHCSRFNKYMVYIRNPQGYFKSVSWQRVEKTTTTETPTTLKSVEDHQDKKPIEDKFDIEIPDIPNIDQLSGVNPTDFADVLNQINELTEKLTDISLGNLLNANQHEEAKPLLKENQTKSNGSPTVLAEVPDADLVNKSISNGTNTKERPFVVILTMVENQTASELEFQPDNSTTSKKEVEETILPEAVEPVAVRDVNPDSPSAIDVVEALESPLEAAENRTISLDEAQQPNVTLNVSRDQNDIEARHEVYPGAYVFNRAFVLGVTFGHEACERTFSSCFKKTDEIIELGVLLVLGPTSNLN